LTLRVEINTDNIKKYAEAMKGAPAPFRREVDETIGRAADIVVKYAKEGVRVKTGKLRRSIRAVKKGMFEHVVEARTDYAAYVEFGTRAHDIFPKRKQFLHFFVDDKEIFTKHVRHPGTLPFPFLRPSIERVKPRLLQSLKEMFKKFFGKRLRLR